MKEYQSDQNNEMENQEQKPQSLADQIMAQTRHNALKVCKKSTQGAGFKEKKATPDNA